jgi:hypothetical protein
MALALMSCKKQCSSCKQFLDYSMFSKDVSAKDGLQYKCRQCDKEYQQKRRLNKKEDIQKYSREYRNKNLQNFKFRLQALLNASRQRAKEKGLEHTLVKEDLKELFPVDNKCPVYGFDLEWNSGGFRETSPSIDRIDSTKGYTKDNIQIISWKANRIKGYASVEDLEILLAYMKQGE